MVSPNKYALHSANKYLNQQEKLLDYKEKVDRLSADGRKSVDLSESKYTKQVEYINKLLTPANEHVNLGINMPINKLAEQSKIDKFSELVAALNDNNDNSYVTTFDLDGLDLSKYIRMQERLLEEQKIKNKAMLESFNKGRVTTNDARGIIRVSEDTFSQTTFTASDFQLYNDVVKASNDPDYEKGVDERIDNALKKKYGIAVLPKGFDYVPLDSGKYMMHNK